MVSKKNFNKKHLCVLFNKRNCSICFLFFSSLQWHYMRLCMRVRVCARESVHDFVCMRVYPFSARFHSHCRRRCSAFFKGVFIENKMLEISFLINLTTLYSNVHSSLNLQKTCHFHNKANLELSTAWHHLCN